MKRELDVKALYAAVESKKGELDLSWRKLAEELELADHTVFTRMSRGQVPEVDTLLSLSGWLGVPLDHFARGEIATLDSRRETIEAISSYLRADEALAPESAEALTSVLRAAYDQLAQRQTVEA
ncbi:MAG TPA: helix-turn-helix domain-containing protein [Gaiellaceae bacterium]